MQAVRDRGRRRDSNDVLTLGDAIAAVSAVTADEREVVAVVLHMLHTRRIRLVDEAPSFLRH